MPDDRVTLLGTPCVCRDGAVIHFPYRKAEGVFYYICVEKQTSRDELVSLFWSSCDENTGRKNLRQALFQIRRCLGDEVIILQGRNDLKLNQRVGLRTDWDAPDSDFALSRERFLDFFYLKDCPEFETWVEQKREQQLTRSLTYIKRQLSDMAVCRNTARLQELVDVWKLWRPWDEEMVLTGMKCFAQTEKYDLGLKLYQEYADRLRSDLDEPPSHLAELMQQTLLHRKKLSSLRRPDARDSFFGRLVELQYIDERIFWFLNENTTRSVVIEGDVGVGKTALMDQVLKMNYGTDVLQLSSHCYGLESDLPVKSWRDLFLQLENLCEIGTIHLSEQGRELLSSILPLNTDWDAHGAEGTAALISNVLALFKELVNQWRIIMYFDSLQWMDPVSQLLMQRMMIEFGNDRIFLIATCRTGEEKNVRGMLLALQERNMIVSLPLNPFTEEETASIASKVLDEPITDDKAVHKLFLRTGGNPLALMETLNAIRQEGWNSDHPLPRIDMLIQLRLDRLTGQQRRVLDALSIQFEQADLEDLTVLTGLPPMELVDLLDQLLAVGLVVEQPWNRGVVYKFKQQFYKHYVYQRLAMGKRQLWHHTMAEYYDTQKTGRRWRVLLPYTIRHYECGGDPERAETLRKMQNVPESQVPAPPHPQ